MMGRDRRTTAGRLVTPRTDSWSAETSYIVDGSQNDRRKSQHFRKPDPKRATMIGEAFEREFRQKQMLNPSQATAGYPGRPIFVPASAIATHPTWGSLEGGRISVHEVRMGTPPPHMQGAGRVGPFNFGFTGTADDRWTLVNGGLQGTATADGADSEKTRQPPIQGPNPASTAMQGLNSASTAIQGLNLPNRDSKDHQPWPLDPRADRQLAPMQGLNPANKDSKDPQSWPFDPRAGRQLAAIQGPNPANARFANTNNEPQFHRAGLAERDRPWPLDPRVDGRAFVNDEPPPFHHRTERDRHLIRSAILGARGEPPPYPDVFSPGNLATGKQHAAGRERPRSPSTPGFFPANGTPGAQREIVFSTEGIAARKQHAAGRERPQSPSPEGSFPGNAAPGAQGGPQYPGVFSPEGLVTGKQHAAGRETPRSPSSEGSFPGNAAQGAQGERQYPGVFSPEGLVTGKQHAAGRERPQSPSSGGSFPGNRPKFDPPQVGPTTSAPQNGPDSNRPLKRAVTQNPLHASSRPHLLPARQNSSGSLPPSRPRPPPSTESSGPTAIVARDIRPLALPSFVFPPPPPGPPPSSATVVKLVRGDIKQSSQEVSEGAPAGPQLGVTAAAAGGAKTAPGDAAPRSEDGSSHADGGAQRVSGGAAESLGEDDGPSMKPDPSAKAGREHADGETPLPAGARQPQKEVSERSSSARPGAPEIRKPDRVPAGRLTRESSLEAGNAGAAVPGGENPVRDAIVGAPRTESEADSSTGEEEEEEEEELAATVPAESMRGEGDADGNGEEPPPEEAYAALLRTNESLRRDLSLLRKRLDDEAQSKAKLVDAVHQALTKVDSLNERVSDGLNELLARRHEISGDVERLRGELSDLTAAVSRDSAETG